MAEQKKTPAKTEAKAEPKTVTKAVTKAPPATIPALKKHAEAVVKKLPAGSTITLTVTTAEEYNGLVIPREETTVHPEAE